jgi:prepilin-type N-terminal cleavage/methylation domain-containing protein/prepilin-type processing-associated H-X9-DG protein
MIGVNSDNMDDDIYSGPWHGEKSSLKDCAEISKRNGLATEAVRWKSLPSGFSLRNRPAILPVVAASNRRHFVCAVDLDADKLLIVDYPLSPIWISLDDLRQKWQWDGTMLHVSQSNESLRALRRLSTSSARASVFMICGAILARFATFIFLLGWRQQRRERSRVFDQRAGFSAIELLVSLGILSILIALILPAILAGRESARKISCANRLHQIGIASQSFDATNGRYPASSTISKVNGTRATNNLAAHVQLLPFLDASDIYLRFDRSESGVGIDNDPPLSKTNSGLLKVSVAAFECPSDVGGAYRCNYRICAGTSPWIHQSLPLSSRGALQGYRSHFGRRDAEFVDGKTYTAAFAEKLSGDRDAARYSPWRDLLSVRPTEVLITADDAAQACTMPSPSRPKHFSFGGTSWVLSGYPQTWYNHVLSPNSLIPDCVAGGPVGHGAFAARSLHPSGVQVLFADGGVRFIAEGIDLATWRACGSIAGGETEATGAF